MVVVGEVVFGKRMIRRLRWRRELKEASRAGGLLRVSEETQSQVP